MAGGFRSFLGWPLSRLGLAFVSTDRLRAERQRTAGAMAHARAKIGKLMEQRQALLVERDALQAARTELVHRTEALGAEVSRLEALAKELEGALEETRAKQRQTWREHKSASRRAEQLHRQVEALHADRARLFSDMWTPSPRAPAWPAPRKAPDAPLVLLAAPGPTALELVRGARIVAPGGWGAGAARPPDLLVLPQPERKDFEAALSNVPEEVWSWTAQGRTRLVLDGSSEGTPHIPGLTRRTHAQAQARGVATSDIAYLTQDRLYEAHYAAFCRDEGLKPMQVVVYDYFLHHMLQRLHGNGERIFEARYGAFQRAPRTGRRKFLSLNLTPRSYKVLFLLRLLKDGLWDEGYVSFGGFGRLGRANEVSKGKMFKRMRALEGFADAVADVAPHLDELDAKGSILFGMNEDPSPRDIVQNSYMASGLQEYRGSWFSVVTETAMSDRLNRVTEKSFKPLLNLHPFIVLGGPGSLALVREYGFQTFEGFFDESYDLEPNRRRRFDMVYDEVVRLARTDETDLARLEAGFSEVIRFNARWGLVDLPRIFEQRIAVDLMARLMAPREH